MRPKMIHQLTRGGAPKWHLACHLLKPRGVNALKLAVGIPD